MLKNRVLTLILAFILSVSANYAIIHEPNAETETQASSRIFESLDEDVQVKQEDNANIDIPAPPEQDVVSTPYKQPVSKKKIAKKFLIAMFCVAISSFAIYLGLTLYNRIRENFNSQSYLPPGEDKSLDTPNDITSAVKTFLEKTKW